MRGDEAEWAKSVKIVSPKHPMAHEQANDFFEAQGFGRPITPMHTKPQLSAALTGDILIGAVFACTPDEVAQTLFDSGVARHVASAVALRFQGVEVLAVDPRLQGFGYGARLLETVEAHAVRDHRAEYMLARIDAADEELHDWYRRRGYFVCEQGDRLEINGVVMTGARDHVDAWRALVESPTVSVRPSGS